MRCAFVVQLHNRNSRRCRAQAEPDSRLCPFHRALEAQDQAVLADERARALRSDLALAAKIEDIGPEIALLRLLIRNMVGAGQLDAARRAIDSLARLLRSHRSHQSRRSPPLVLSPPFAKVLDDLGGAEGEQNP